MLRSALHRSAKSGVMSGHCRGKCGHGVFCDGFRKNGEREKDRESLECKKYRLRTLVEVRTEMAAWSRVVSRRQTSDTTGGLLVTLLCVLVTSSGTCWSEWLSYFVDRRRETPEGFR